MVFFESGCRLLKGTRVLGGNETVFSESGYTRQKGTGVLHGTEKVFSESGYTHLKGTTALDGAWRRLGGAQRWRNLGPECRSASTELRVAV